MPTISINQPSYIPWAGYFERIAKSDVHVILDHVQYEKNSLINRNYIDIQSNSKFLTIPVLQKGRFQNLPINEVLVDLRSKWNDKHLKTLEHSYKKSKNFEYFFPIIAECYKAQKNEEKLVDIINYFNFKLLRYLDIDTDIYVSSKFDFLKKKSDLVLEICEFFECDKYLSGPMGRNYLCLESFRAKGILVEFHDFTPMQYRSNLENLDNNLSILDLLFHQRKEDLKMGIKDV
jgi:hypothetical protein